MELLADRDPEEAREILDPVLERMMEAVHHYEGTVNQVMGNGIMALFGAPLAHEDHAVRACYAALRMQETVQEYAAEILRSRGEQVRIRVGLNSGDVVVRAIGSDLHMDYTAVGQTTHLAARLEQQANPSTVLLSRATVKLVEDYVDVEVLGAVPIKGLTVPVEVYKLVGTSSVRSRLQAMTARGLTQFVGRAPEMEQLERAMERAGAGHGQVLAVVGEAGVGKSRLYWEFTHSSRTQGWRVLESRSVSYGKATSYLPVIDLLKGYFQIEVHDEPRQACEKVTARLLRFDEGLRRTVPAFLSLLDLPVEDASWQTFDPSQRRQRTLDAVKRILLQESQAQPLVVIFEDLHWIDAETQAVLDNLVESLPTARLLLLVNYRPEYNHGWAAKSYYAQLRIDPLPNESAEKLLHALLGSDTDLEPLMHLLIERSDGNPFFLEESVRDLVETGALLGDRGAHRLAMSRENIQVPATVQATIAARLDRLPPEEKRLLQSAAVVGKAVPFALLQAISELPEAELPRALSHLRAAEFLYETVLFPDLEYTFKHAITHEVAYGSALHERRRALHARLVGTIEQLYADRLAEHVERLAHHAARGEMWQSAARYLREAGIKAYARSASRQSIRFFEEALVAVERLPEDRSTAALAIDIRFDLRNSFLATGEVNRVPELMNAVELLANRWGDARGIAWKDTYLTQYFWYTGNLAEAVRSGQRAVDQAENVGEAYLMSAARYYLGLATLAAGRYHDAGQLLLQFIQSITQARPTRHGLAGSPEALSRSFLAFTLLERGRFTEALSQLEQAMTVSEVVEDRYSAPQNYIVAARLHAVRGDAVTSTQFAERALAVAQEWNLGMWPPFALWVLGSARTLAERLVEAVNALEQAVIMFESRGIALFHSLVVLALAEAYFGAQQVSKAVSEAERALALARERNERGSEAHALYFLARVAASNVGADAQAAERHYRQGLHLATELGMRPLVAHCHLGLGKLYRRTGKHEQAREHLNIATTMYREMDMRFWLEQAETQVN